MMIESIPTAFLLPAFPPQEPGAYALELWLEHETNLRVGRLGEARFPAGGYIYLGSARGPGGLQARLKRHILCSGRAIHWHIDHLRRISRFSACAYLATTEAVAIECLWSQALSAHPGAQIPLPGFGASDCRSGCPAHLVGFSLEPAQSKPLLSQPDILTRLQLSVSPEKVKPSVIILFW